MKYTDLPLYNTLDNSFFITFVNDELSRNSAPDAVSEIMDFTIIQSVLSQINSDNTLASHINDPALHIPINDGVVADNSTWSSSQIDTAIDGTSPWFNLDSIPEGSNNLYFTEERAKQAIIDNNNGIPQVDHNQIAGQLASMLLGFNSSLFRYDADDPSVSVSIDGNSPTIGYFEVTPGLHELNLSGRATFRCDQLGHQVSISSGISNLEVTPRLTLDSFVDGSTNKLFTPDNFTNSPILDSINNHLVTNFAENHIQINDSSTSSTNSTWSSKKTISYFLSEFNQISSLTSHKELSVMHERSSSGGHPSSYSWTTVQTGSDYRHYIKRLTSNDNWNENISTSSDEWFIDPGTWFIYWVASENINPYFTNLSNVVTYMALDSSPDTPVLEHPGVISITSRTNYTLVTAFTTDQAYSSSYRNNWLVPRGIPGIDELYSIVHIERIR